MLHSDGARQGSRAAETGLCEGVGDPSAYARPRPERVKTRRQGTSDRLQTKGVSYCISFASFRSGLHGSFAIHPTTMCPISPRRILLGSGIATAQSYSDFLDGLRTPEAKQTMAAIAPETCAVGPLEEIVLAYEHTSVEPKWQARWQAAALHQTTFNPNRPKFYVLYMFPYPSGSGLHVGHCEGYTATDIVARWKRMQGWNVLHPMGWDAFGLPAENYAIKTGIHPRITTRQAIANFRRQIDSIGFTYDWERETTTTDPAYVRWTQWIFLQIYQAWFDPTVGKARPIAEKGKEPTTNVPRRRANSTSGMRTPPATIPSANRASTMMALKIMLVMTLAAK